MDFLNGYGFKSNDSHTSRAYNFLNIEVCAYVIRKIELYISRNINNVLINELVAVTIIWSALFHKEIE